MAQNAHAYASDPLEPIVVRTLEEHADRLTELSQSIWMTPELCYEEFHAVELLTAYLEREKYKLTRKYCNLETSFLAEFETKNFNPADHATVAVLCEYDALPEIGHACGHNLIAEAGLGTFLAVCAALKSSSVEGKVVCMGTPAEEGGAGKVRLLEAGGFCKIDFAMMAHGSPVDLLEPTILGVEHICVEYFGKAAHASCGPWEGVNALDAAIAAYNNVALLRQQLKPANQIHVNILNGGSKPNVIPDYTKSQYFIRTPTVADSTALKARLLACLEAAAVATGCRMELSYDNCSLTPLMSNKTMLSVYKHFGQKHGMSFPHVRPSYGSTDMGNVSTVIPSMHPAFDVGGMQMIHTKEFQVLAGKPTAHKYARRTAVAMAMTTLELLSNPEFRKTARLEFETTKTTFVGNTEQTDDCDGF